MKTTTTHAVRADDGRVLAIQNGVGTWHCTACKVWLQRTATGDIRDGVLAHYRTCHYDPNKRSS